MTSSQQKSALDDYRRYTEQYANGQPMKYDSAGNLVLEDVGPTGLGDITTDPRYKENELAALRELEDQSRNGFTSGDLADITRTENLANRANRGRIESIRQGMQARGMGGGGLDIMAQMQSAQDANELEALKALEREGMMQDRKSSATMNLGSLSSQLQGRDYAQQSAKAQAQDTINKFNAANRNQAAQYNMQNRQQVQNMNTAGGNDWRDKQFGARTGMATTNYNAATDEENRKRMEAEARKKKSAGAMSGMLGAAGGIVGGIYGGPMGAAAGASVGSAAGNAIGGYAHGGMIPGDSPFPGDDPRNDIYNVPVSPGEVVLPRTIARDPNAAADFVARQSPGLADQYRSRMQKEDEEVANAERMQGYGSMANVAGKLLNDYGNSQKSDVILENRFEDMGKAPKVMEAERKGFDGSMVDRLGSAGVQTAKDNRTRSDGEFFKEQQLKQMDTARTRDQALNDPKSAESQSARDFIKSVFPKASGIQGFDGFSAARLENVSQMLIEKWKAERAQSNSDREYALHKGALGLREKEANKAASEKPIPAEVAGKLGDYDAAEKIVDALSQSWDKNAAKQGSYIESYIPGSKSNLYDKGLDAAVQAFGTALEGGKLTDPDFDKYMRMAPKNSDTKEQKAAKIDAIKQNIAMKKKAHIDTLKASGYKTPAPSSSAPQGEKITVSNGKETLLIDPADLEHAVLDGFKEVP